MSETPLQKFWSTLGHVSFKAWLLISAIGLAIVFTGAYWMARQRAASVPAISESLPHTQLTTTQPQNVLIVGEIIDLQGSQLTIAGNDGLRGTFEVDEAVQIGHGDQVLTTSQLTPGMKVNLFRSLESYKVLRIVVIAPVSS